VSFVVEGEATVTATAENVAVTPASSLRIVDRGSKAEFSVTANSGYVLSQTVGGDCPGGSWSGNTYTTGDVTVSCTLSFGATKTNPCPSVIANVSFANDIQPLLSQPLGDSRACTACHNPSEVGKVEFAASVSGPAVYQQLIAGRGATVGATIVEPRDPLASLLYTKTTTAPPSGEMMPQDGPTYLTDTQRSKICNWIYDGANNN
jgi:hypothetical protein